MQGSLLLYNLKLNRLIFSTSLNSSLIIFIRPYIVNYRNALDRLRVRMNIILYTDKTTFGPISIFFPWLFLVLVISFLWVFWHQTVSWFLCFRAHIITVGLHQIQFLSFYFYLKHFTFSWCAKLNWQLVFKSVFKCNSLSYRIVLINITRSIVVVVAAAAAAAAYGQR